jgi:EAL domain-containing protein (putative c-di-GMP-specific phosphodiesterase class I)
MELYDGSSRRHYLWRRGGNASGFALRTLPLRGMDRSRRSANVSALETWAAAESLGATKGNISINILICDCESFTFPRAIGIGEFNHEQSIPDDIALIELADMVVREIPPARFIPIAEHSGLIVELGEHILRRACLDGRNWPGLAVSVNVSPLQFRRPDFVEAIERIVGETGFEPNRLELELTESTLLGNLENAELSMLRLKGSGVCFALDDFGTGYSSLLYLRRFPFDKLKIDSSFVRSIEKAADAAAIVHAVVSLGRGLGMKVTAEGVETADQHLFLRAAGVHSMQRYRFGKPVNAAEINHRPRSITASSHLNPTRSPVPIRKLRSRAERLVIPGRHEMASPESIRPAFRT